MTQHLWLIHGNLQNPTVWDAFTKDLQSHYVIHKENLWTTQESNFWSWADHFCNKVSQYSFDTQHHLVGYSLGGRLGLHAILHKPDLWQSAMIIASDTGLSNDVEKAKQLAWDKAWGQRFLSEDWDTLLSEWNQLSVFQGIENPNPPFEKDFSRETIAMCFENFSKGHQDNLLPKLEQLQSPNITYVTGSLDKKYCAKGEALTSTCSVVRHEVIDNAAHRVPWENVEGLKKLLGKHLQGKLD